MADHENHRVVAVNSAQIMLDSENSKNNDLKGSMYKLGHTGHTAGNGAILFWGGSPLGNC